MIAKFRYDSEMSPGFRNFRYHYEIFAILAKIALCNREIPNLLHCLLHCNLLDFSLRHLGKHSWIDSALLGSAALLVSPNYSERHLYWPETHMCLPEMLLN